MVHHLVNALPELRVLVGKKLRTHAGVSCAPPLATIIGAINATRGDCDQHPLSIDGIEHDGVEAKSAASGLPFGLVLVSEKPFIRRPALAAIARLEERRRLDTAVERIRLVRASRCDLPDLGYCALRIRG